MVAPARRDSSGAGVTVKAQIASLTKTWAICTGPGPVLRTFTTIIPGEKVIRSNVMPPGDGGRLCAQVLVQIEAETISSTGRRPQRMRMVLAG